MRKGNTTDLGTRVREYFDTLTGEVSAKQAAEALGVAPNTIGQYLLSYAEWGTLSRRMHGIARGRHYVYAKATDPAGLEPQQTVWYDDSRGRVVRCFDWGGNVTVNWDDGNTGTVRRSDLLTDAEYKEMDAK